jgi:PAS domain-containing protein
LQSGIGGTPFIDQAKIDHADGGLVLDAVQLELILARNLVSSISVAAILIDAEGRIVFFNEAAADVIGAPFEEIGVLEPEEWNAKYGPLDADGMPMPRDQLPVATAVREARPAHARLSVRTEHGIIEIEVFAVPLTGPAGYRGSMVVFWPLSDGGGE